MRHDATKEIAEAVREATAPLHAEIGALEATIRDVNGLSEIRLQRIAERDTLIAAHQAENERLKGVVAHHQDCINYWGDLCCKRERELAEEREARSIAETALTDYTRLYSEQSERNRALIDTVARLDAENAELRACRTAAPNPVASVVGASDDDGELVAVDFFDTSGLVLGGVDVTAGKVVWSVAGGESGSMENPAMRCRTAAESEIEALREQGHEQERLLLSQDESLKTYRARVAAYENARTAADLQREREREEQQRRSFSRSFRSSDEPGDWPGIDSGIDA